MKCWHCGRTIEVVAGKDRDDLDGAAAMPTLHRQASSLEGRMLHIWCLVGTLSANEASNKNRRVTKGTETIQSHALSCGSALIA